MLNSAKVTSDPPELFLGLQLSFSPKLARFRNVLLKQRMAKGHTEFLEWSVSVSAVLFSTSVSMKLYWKGVLAANINVSPALTYSASVIHKMIYISSSITHSHSQQREAEIVWLRASVNLDGFWALQLSSQSTHKYVAVVEHPAATANTAQQRPFLCTHTPFVPHVHIYHEISCFLDVCFSTWWDFTAATWQWVGDNSPVIEFFCHLNYGNLTWFQSDWCR